ncbi:MAG: hypothetical protein ABFD16_06130, partial [Thermoguttaceae bacterium]
MLRRPPPHLLALLAFAAWSSAGYLLFSRTHLVYGYDVFGSATFWDWRPLFLLTVGAVISAAAWHVARPLPGKGDLGDLYPAFWLLSSAVIPIAAQVRQTIPLPPALAEPSFLEPLFFAFISGMAVWRTTDRLAPRLFPDGPPRVSRWPSPWFWGVVAVSVALAGWWFYQAHLAYNDYLLGFQDFGIFA